MSFSMSCHYIFCCQDSSLHNPLLRSTKNDYYEQEAFRVTEACVRSILICAGGLMNQKHTATTTIVSVTNK